MKANRRMLLKMSTYFLAEVVGKVRLTSSLKHLLECPLVEYEEGVFLKALLVEPQKNARLQYEDLTAWESLVNHIHIDDYVRKPKGNDILLQGMKYATELTKKLRKYKAGKSTFRVIVSFENRGGTVRFHKYRRKEGNWIAQDLEGFALEDICVFNTGESRDCLIAKR